MSGHKHTFYVHGIKKVFKVNFPFQTFLPDGCSLSVSAGLAGTCWMPLLYLELEQVSYWIWKLCQKIQKWGIMKYKICAVAVFFFSLFCVLIFFFISFFHSFGPPLRASLKSGLCTCCFKGSFWTYNQGGHRRNPAFDWLLRPLI